MKLKTLKTSLASAPGRLATLNPDSWRSTKTGATARGYTYRWERERLRFLEEHPLCGYCERDGRVTAATVLDHIEPHRGDMVLFWQRSNWQPLCKPCHDGEKKRQEAAADRHTRGRGSRL